MRNRDSLVCMGAAAALACSVHGDVIHVNAAAPPGGDGSSWATAIGDLRQALSIGQDGDQVWVARGIYKPASTTDPSIRFNIPSGIKVYGGFIGGETSIGQRPADPDPAAADPAHDTILSGEIGGPGIEDNTATVVEFATGASAATLLDRVSITRGYRIGTLGGGMRANSQAAGAITNCLFIDNEANQAGGLWADAPTGLILRDSIFINNRTNMDGGGSLVSAGSITIERCTFRGNNAGRVGFFGVGGGLAATSGTFDLRDCLFESNSAIYGGGLYVDSQALVERCTIRNNNAFSPTDPTGATRGFGGGIYTQTGPYFRQCIIEGNTGVNSGALANEGQGTTYESCRFLRNHANTSGVASIREQGTRFINCLFAKNTASFNFSLMTIFSVPSSASVTFINCTAVDNGPAATAMLVSGTALVINSIFRNPGNEFDGNLPGAGWSNIEGGAFGLANIDSEPVFMDVAGEDYRLAAGSPGIDAGRNDQLPPGIVSDISGSPRFVDDPSTADTGVGAGPIVDMGAFEYAPTVSPCPGDADGDRRVTFGDIAAVLGNFGASGAAYGPGDADGSGTVNFADIASVLGNFGADCP